MSTKYFCDRCNTESKSMPDKVLIPAPLHNYKHKINRTLDLCDSCITKLNDWVSPLPIGIVNND